MTSHRPLHGPVEIVTVSRSGREPVKGGLCLSTQSQAGFAACVGRGVLRVASGSEIF